MLAVRAFISSHDLVTGPLKSRHRTFGYLVEVSSRYRPGIASTFPLVDRGYQNPIMFPAEPFDMHDREKYRSPFGPYKNSLLQAFEP